MTTLPIPNALELSAKKLGLHVKTTATDGGALTTVLVYRNEKDNRALVTWERGTGLVIRRGLPWAGCSLAEAQGAMRAKLREIPGIPSALCKCGGTAYDQVQALRKELELAQAWSDKHEAEAERLSQLLQQRAAADIALRQLGSEMAQELEELRQSLGKAHAAASAAGAQLRAAQLTRERAVHTAIQRSEEHTELLGMVRRCLAKMPEDMEHGGCLETAVDLLRAAMLMPHGTGVKLAREIDEALEACDTKPENPLDGPRMDGQVWIPASDVTQAMLDAWPVWECERFEGVSPHYVPSVAVRSHWQHLAGLWRPLRLPGMNAKGKMLVEDVSNEARDRIGDWQVLDDHGCWTLCDMDEFSDPDCDAFVVRPAIFSKLDQEETTMTDDELVAMRTADMSDRARLARIIAYVSEMGDVPEERTLVGEDDHEDTEHWVDLLLRLAEAHLDSLEACAPPEDETT